MKRTSILVAWARATARKAMMRRLASRAALVAYQDRRMQRHLADVLPLSPFHRARFEHVQGGSRRLGAWRELTPIDKSAMMGSFEQFNTLGIRAADALLLAREAERTRAFNASVKGVTVGLSSGTSGQQGVFLVSDAERAAWAGTILAHALPHSLLHPRRDRVAFFLRANSRLYQTLDSRRLRFEFFDLLAPLEEHLPRLKALSPTILVAPPSLLAMLADLQCRGEIALRPERVTSVAEVLDPLDKARIRDAFERPVHQIYQATEGLLGATCGHGTLHLMEDAVAFDREPVADDTRIFHPILSDLWRSTQPILRYRLDDVLVERAAPCPCGSIALAIDRIEGRADDVLIAYCAAGAPRPIFPDFVRRALPAAHPGLLDYTVTQVAPNTLEVSCVCDAGVAPSSVHEAVSAALATLTVAHGGLPHHIRWVDMPVRRPGDKLRRVRRTVTSQALVELVRARSTEHGRTSGTGEQLWTKEDA